MPPVRPVGLGHRRLTQSHNRRLAVATLGRLDVAADNGASMTGRGIGGGD